MNTLHLFKWLRTLKSKTRDAPALPEWATLIPTGADRPPRIRVDADKAYTAILNEIERAPATLIDRELYKYDGKPDRYWLEVAYHFIKLDLQAAMGYFRFEIHIKDPGKKWAQREYEKGLSALLASRGLHARKHYEHVRGFLPGKSG